MNKLNLRWYSSVPSKLLNRFSLASAIVFFAVMLPFVLVAQAPTISYSGPQTYTAGTGITLAPVSSGVAAPGYGSPTVFGSGFNLPTAVAADAAGNVYVADAGHNLVKKFPAGGGSPVILGSGFNFPTSVAVDAAGNVFVADYKSNAVKEIPAASGSTIVLGSGFYHPNGVAVDAAGNVYVSDAGHGMVKKIQAGGGVPILLASGFVQPAGIAVDTYGNLFVADAGNSTVNYIPAGGGYPVPIASGYNGPVGIAVSYGNIYIADADNNRVEKIPVGGWGGAPVIISSGFNSPSGVAIDGAGNIYVADQLNNAVKKIQPLGGYYLSPTLPLGLIFDNSTGIISGAPAALSPATNYTITAYNSSGSSAATVNIAVVNAISLSYASPLSFLAGTTIGTPVTPTNSGVAAAGYSSKPFTIGSGFKQPASVAIDAGGNVLVGDLGFSSIRIIPASGGPVVTVPLADVPAGVAVDGAGNLFVGDNTMNNVIEFPVGGSTSFAIGSGFNSPQGLAVDSWGNVFVADATNTVYKIPFGTVTRVAYASGFNSPYGIAVDSWGNVFVADAGNNAVKEIPVGGGSPIILGSGFNGPRGVAVDAAGNVFVADFGNNAVKEIPAGGGAPITIGSGFYHPTGVTVDGAGNVYVADTGNGLVKVIKPVGGFYINRTLPAGLSFANNSGKITGTPTISSPATDYTVTAYNSFGGISATVNVAVPALTINYTSPKVFTAGTTIAALAPTVTGTVAAPGYSAMPVNLGVYSNNLKGVAVDASGNVYIIGGNFEGAFRFPPGGGTPVQVAIGGESFTSIAVDPGGNIYGVSGTQIVLFPSDGSQQVVLSDGSFMPGGLAVDAAGNVYITDGVSNQLKEIPAGGGDAVVLASGFNNPKGVAVDAAGNVYVADAGNNVIKKVPANGGPVITLDPGIIAPNDVAVDALGNVYILDSGLAAVKKMPVGGGGYVTIGSHLDFSIGVAVDGAGNVYTVNFLNGLLQEIKPAGGYYINTPLPAGLSFSSSTGIISGTPTSYSQADNYVITAYNNFGSNSATLTIKVNLPPVPAINYSSPQNYTVGTAITALAPTTTGVAAAAYSTTPGTLGSGFINPSGVAVDAAGNVYIADFGNNLVKMIPAGGGSPVTLGSGFNGPVSVAVDAAGNVYVADENNSAIKEIPAGNGSPVTLGSGFNHPDGVAVDALGNVYVADPLNNAIKKIPVGGVVPITLATGFNSPAGVAVDAAGNVYVADLNNNAVKKIPVGGGAVVTLGSGFNQPTGVAVDGAGNVFVADYQNSAIKEIPAAGGAPISLGSGFNHPFGVAVSGNGFLFVADYLNNAVKRIKPIGGYYVGPFLPAGLTFNSSTGVIAGTPTTASVAANYTITAYNKISVSSSAVVNITVVNNANLLHLTISAGTLTPAFSSTTTSYTASVANATASITVTPTTSDPTATVTVNGTPVTSGAASASIPLNVGPNTITTIVTAHDGVTTKTYTLTITRAPSSNALLASIATLPAATLVGTTGPGYLNFTVAMPNSVSSIQLVPTAKDATATITVNGTTVASGAASQSIALPVGPTVITTVITAQDGVTTKTIIVTVTRAPSSNAGLSNIALSSGTLTPAFVTSTTSYAATVNDIGSVTFTPTTADAGATLTVNGAPVTSGMGVHVTLANGANPITTVVTAQDGTTKKTYTTTVTLVPGTNAQIATIATTPTVSLVGTTGTGYLNFRASVPNSFSSIQEIVTLKDPLATMTVNGIAATSGSPSQAIALAVGPTVITTVITAQDGVTQKTVIVTVTRAAPPANTLRQDGLSINKPTESIPLNDDGVLVHQALSPNGDGINDFVTIENITSYPDNHLTIIDRNGNMVYEAKGYDNAAKVFDGHAANGKMQLSGTYFYSLDYTANGENKHKTGYIILKY